jgi:quercetin dioxygenase-like cupin family protein
MSAARIFATGSIVLALAVSAPLHAQDKGKAKGEKAVVTKVLLENDKVRVTESTFEPGAVSRADRKARTNYIVTDGTLERVTKDGKKTRYTRKAGTALYLEPDNDVVTNVGKTKYVVIGITHK